MQQAAVIKSAEELRADKEEAGRAARERAGVAEARKERMRGMEASRLAAVPLSQLQQEKKDEEERRRELARKMQDERQDDMKKMDSIYNFAITTAIRDRQLLERKRVEEESKTAERMRELKIDIEQLEAQKKADELEVAKAAKRGEYKGLMWGQLEETRARQAEARAELEREGVARAAKAKQDVINEHAAREEERVRKAASTAANVADNEAQIEAKRERKRADLALEQKAALEAIAIDKKRAAELEEAEVVRKEKERVSAIAAGMVEKFNDDRDARDELIMRRAYEAGMRVERDKALARLRERVAAQKELDEARADMAAAKEVRMAEMIAAEKEEYMRAKAMQSEWLAKEAETDEARARANAELLRALQGQKEDARARAKAAREADISAENARRAEVAANLDHLRALRNAKVEQLRALGVNEKIVVELQRYDPLVQQSRKEMVPSTKNKGGAAAAKK